MAERPLPTPDELRQLLRYDAETGKLYWRERTPEMFRLGSPQSPQTRCGRWNKRYAGKEAFTALNGGYPQGMVWKKHIAAHRAIWAMAHGYWPEIVDHINGNPLDNRLSNLREVDAEANSKNLALPHWNTSGVMGVSRTPGRRNGRPTKWRAYITHKGKFHVLGDFATFDEAVSARAQAEKEFGFHPNHGKRLKGGAIK